MAKMTIGKGVDEYVSLSNDLKYRISGFCGRALYEGAKILADATRAELEALPVESSGGRGAGRRNPTQVEKDGLLEGMGVAKKRVSGDSVNITIGFDGYNADETYMWPSGKPNAMIARSINKGTSFMNRIPFARNVISKSRASAESAMIAEIDKQLKETMGNG